MTIAKRLYDLEVRRNRVKNPSPHIDTTGYAAFPSGSADITRFLATSVPGFEDRSFPVARATFIDNPTASTGIHLGQNTPQRAVVTPGEELTASIATRANYPTARALYLSWYTDTGTFLSSHISDYVAASTGEWTVHEQTVTVPAGALRVRVGVILQVAPEIGDTVDLTTVQAGAPRPYFDGAIDAPNLLTNYQWEGTPGASESTEYAVSPENTIEPLLISMPWEAAHETRTLTHQLLHDSVNLFTYRPPAPRSGHAELMFDSYAAAHHAIQFFTAPTPYVLHNPVDGGHIEHAFMVAGDDIELEQSDEVAQAWIVRVPWQEYTP